MSKYREAIKAGGEIAAEKSRDAAMAIASLAALEEQRLRTDREIAVTLKQLYQRKEAVNKAIALVESVQMETGKES